MAESTIGNALSEHALFGLGRIEAEAQIRQVAAVVVGWKTHFVEMGVQPNQIDALAQEIDRSFLAEQRSAWSGSAA